MWANTYKNEKNLLILVEWPLNVWKSCIDQGETIKILPQFITDNFCETFARKLIERKITKKFKGQLIQKNEKKNLNFYWVTPKCLKKLCGLGGEYKNSFVGNYRWFCKDFPKKIYQKRYHQKINGLIHMKNRWNHLILVEQLVNTLKSCVD